MCGRFTIVADVKKLEQRWHAIAQRAFLPRYNAAPSQQLPIITNHRAGKIILGCWGLQPSWLRSKSGLINARAESIQERPAFQNALRLRRCLILADGFFEWDQNRQPYYFTLPQHQPFAFAGIWEPARNPDRDSCPTFAIITSNANATVAPVHYRMPVILSPGEESTWLDAKAQPEKELALLRPYAEPIESRRVSNLINSVKNDTPSVIKPI
ncbi:MAG: SOS response-associated peptidase [Patescibacteria group bacterium]|jgi:putative SOS response-associated peptidase YedK